MRSALAPVRNTSPTRYALLAAGVLALVPTAPALAEEWLVVDGKGAPLGVTPEDAALLIAAGATHRPSRSRASASPWRGELGGELYSRDPVLHA